MFSVVWLTLYELFLRDKKKACLKLFNLTKEKKYFYVSPVDRYIKFAYFPFYFQAEIIY